VSRISCKSALRQCCRNVARVITPLLKQSYTLEDVRVRSYTALRNTCVLAHAIFYFVSVVIGAKVKMNLIFKKVCEKAKRFCEVATFYQYTVADGIHRLLFGFRSDPRTLPRRRGGRSGSPVLCPAAGLNRHGRTPHSYA